MSNAMKELESDQCHEGARGQPMPRRSWRATNATEELENIQCHEGARG